MPPEAATIRATDGYGLAATVYAPERPRAVALLNSALAVPREYYAPFAEELAARGFAAVTYDYRGIGGSKPARVRGARMRMRDWAEHDIAGAIGFTADRWPGLPVAAVGHSCGGWLLGLVPGAERLAGAVLVAAQDGYVGRWPWPMRAWLYANWYAVAPTLPRLLGYAPGWMGLGEHVPAGIVLEWARWCRDPEFVLGDASVARDAYSRLRFPAIAFAFSDDDYAPRAAVEALVARFPTPPTIEEIGPRDAGGPLGHFGAFRPRARASVWPRLVRAVEQVSGVRSNGG